MNMAVSTAQSIGGIRVEPRPACMICGSSGDLLYDALVDHQYGVPGKWSLRQCSNSICSLVWQDPMIANADLPLAYKSYYTHNGHDAFGPGNVWTKAFAFLDRRIASLHGLIADRIRYKHGFLDQRPPGSLLDIGCGNGDFAAGMRSRGWSVQGTDADPDAARTVSQNHGFQVDVGELNDLAYPDGAFDAVTAKHVLEHIRNPQQFARECWRILKPGGRLVMVTPTVSSHGHQIYREHWQGLEPPRHLFLYGPPHLACTSGHLRHRTAINFFDGSGCKLHFPQQRTDSHRKIRCPPVVDPHVVEILALERRSGAVRLQRFSQPGAERSQQPVRDS